MLNVEKYEEEIRNGFTEQTAIGCATKKSREGNCNDELDCNTCCLKSFNWLLKEYKEPINPILTDKEKAYLKNVIEFVRHGISYIRKGSFMATSIEYVTIQSKTSQYSELASFVTTQDMPFENMKLWKKYTLKELGL